jgi:hypothetical protein
VSSLHGLDAVWAPEVILQQQIHEIEFRTANISEHDLQTILDEIGIFAADVNLRHAHTRKCLALYRLALSEASSALNPSSYVPRYSSLLDPMAAAARNYLDEVSERDSQFSLFSMQLTTECVLQAGAILGAYLIILSTASFDMEQQPPEVSHTEAILCLMEVSTLLSSFRHRWIPCSAYIRLWNAFTECVLAISTR